MMAVQFLQREIRPFFWKVGTEYYNGRIAPLIMDTPSADSDDSAGEALNVLWVPATLGEKRFNHILTLLPWKCGLEIIFACLVLVTTGRRSGARYERRWYSTLSATNSTTAAAWGSPIGFSGSEIGLLQRLGFGNLKWEGKEMRGCYYEWDTGIGYLESGIQETLERTENQDVS